MSQPTGFGKLRSLFWPIYASEHRRFVPMLLLFFLVCFNYNILRASKDALIVTAPLSGAEALPFLKVWAILPFALLFTFIFTRLSNWLSREKVFYSMIGIFLGFFLIFTFALFPNQDALHPHAFCDRLQSFLPQGFSGMIAIIRNWTFTAFYVMSEMWSTMVMSVLFWGFANEVTNVRDGRRFYAILSLGANIATIFAGQVANLVCSHSYTPLIPFGQNGWDQAVFLLNALVVIAGILCMAIFRWLHKQGLGYGSVAAASSEKKQKIKMGIRENFKYLAKSKYLVCIAIVVLMFNVSLTLIEVVWKDQVKQLYPHPADYTSYLCQVLTWIGAVATVSAFISSSIMRRFSWTFSAMIPPAIFLLTGIGFFSFLLFKDSALSSLALIFGTTPLAIGVFFGSMQNVLARASKYTLFDATKELSFIPLSKESRMKGKAAIDGFGSRLGKSGASIFHQGLIMIFGTISVSAPFVGGFLLVVILGWMAATRVLGKEFQKLTLAKESLELEKESPELVEEKRDLATTEV